MKYECECCGEEFEHKPLTCSDKCRVALVRNPNKDSKNVNNNVRKANKIEEIAKDRDDIFSGNRFELCKKHSGSMKITCGCK